MAPSKNSQPQRLKQPPQFTINGDTDGFYRQLVEQAADGCMTIDLKGDILYANRAARDILRLPAKDMVGQHFIVFLNRESRRKVGAYIKEVKMGATVIRDELVVVDSKKKALPIEFTLSPIYKNKEVVQLHISLRDISRRRQLEQLTHESAKMTAIQHFISGTTHEIQYPLKGLLKEIDHLIKNYKDRDYEYIGFKEFNAIFKTLENVRDQAKYCSETADRLVSISKRKVGLRSNHCDVNKTIQDAINTLKYTIFKSGITVKTKLGSSVPPAAIGEIELAQVLVKLITNAIQAISSGGHIEIRSSFLASENKIRIECIDDGIGISKDDLSRVFDPFFTTKVRGLEKSSGLGLAIVYSIIVSFQGSISISSNLKEGTRVKLLLPSYKTSRKKQ